MEFSSRVDEVDSSRLQDGAFDLNISGTPWSRLPTNNLSKYVFDHGKISTYKFGEVGLKNPRMASFYERLRSFDQGWPRQMMQTPQALASAGFYYEGVGDRVITFCCEVGVRNWNSYDEPWQEHKKHSPCCNLAEIVGK